MVRETVLSSLTAAALVLEGDPRDMKAWARWFLATVGLDGMETRQPLSLSGGEQRRLATVSSAFHVSGVLLVDEPIVGLDRLTWAAMTGILISARGAETGVMIAIHGVAPTRLVNRRVRLPSPPVDGEEGFPVVQGEPASGGLLKRTGPLSPLFGVVLLTVSGVTAGGLLPLAIGIAALVIVGMVLLRLRFPSRRLVTLRIATVSIAWSNWLLSDPRTVKPALVVALWVTLIVLPGMVIASLLKLTTLGDHLGGLLQIPSRLVLAAVTALHRLDRFTELWQEISWAQWVRGVGPDHSPISKVRKQGTLCLVLLVESVRQAGRLTIAMDSRGYSAPGLKTWFGEIAQGRKDTEPVVIAAALATLSHPLGAFV